MKKDLFKEMLVWLIVIVGLVIFCAFAFVIGSNQGRILGGYTVFRVQMKESSGVNVGTKVNIHGRRTGNVIKMELLPSGIVELSLSIKKDHSFIINESSRIELKNSGALGDRYINILTPDLSADKIKKNSLIPYEESVSLLSFLTGSSKGSENTFPKILNQLEGILSQINKNGVVNILSQSDKEELSQILKSTNNILKKIESGQGTLGALLNDPSLYNRLLVLLGERPKKNYLEDLSKKSSKKR